MKIIIPAWIKAVLPLMCIHVCARAQAAHPVLMPSYFGNAAHQSLVMISLSELLPVSDDQRVLLFDELTKNDTMVLDSVRFVNLSEHARQKLLQYAGIGESDQLFLLDPTVSRRSVSVPVSRLKAVAYLDTYVSELPVNESDYFIGFALDTALVSENNRWPFAAFGRKNPFEQKGLTQIHWSMCQPADFPPGGLPTDEQYAELQPGSCYQYQSGDHHFYLREYLSGQMVVAKHLIVKHSQSGEKVCEKVYVLCENCDFAPPNEQYAGKLLKGSPEVIFGFIYPAYSCPTISVIDKTDIEIPVYCDNRN